MFTSSQIASRVLVQRVSGKLLMLLGVGLATAGLLLATQLTAHSSYPVVLASLMLFGAGNGLSFLTLTSAALAGVAPADAGAASGLINVTQQLGGTLGVAVLVTVFGSASKSEAAHLGTGPDPAAIAAQVFVHAADRAFMVATLFLVAAIVMVAIAVKAPKLRNATVPVEPAEPSDGLQDRELAVAEA